MFVSEMVDSMKSIAQMGVGLTSEERNLLSVAYKNTIGARRASWRIVSSIEAKASGDDGEIIAAEYRKVIEKELTSICDDILDVLDKHLIPSLNDGDSTDQKEAAVFYYKL